MEMKSVNIHLRALEPEDIGYLYRWENDPMIWKVSNTLVPYSKYILKKYIENSHLDIFETKQVRFVIVHNQTNIPIGAVDLFDYDPHNRRVGLGILIYDEKDRGKGFASEAISLIVQYCFEVLSLHQIYCNAISNNSCSIEMFKTKGFEVTGVKKDWVILNDKWYDEVMLQRIKSSDE